MVGFVNGAGLSIHDKPKHNLTGAPYFTDGLRAGLEFGRRPSHIEDVRFFDLETPAHHLIYSDQ